MNKDGKYFLKKFLHIAPLSHALWRTPEALVFDSLKLQNPILDLGCGFGEFAGVVFNQIEVGVDINSHELKQALSGKSYKKVKWADARKLPFPNEKFSSVVSVSVVEHIPGVEKAIAEVSRVLKKGGFFAFTVPTKDLYADLFIPKLFKILGLEGVGKYYFKQHCKMFKHVDLKTPQWWVKELEKNNFKVLEKSGTISPAVAKLHEVFLITALPSQLWKWIFKRRLIISVGTRSKFLPIFFHRYTNIDKNCTSNMFFLAQKL